MARSPDQWTVVIDRIFREKEGQRGAVAQRLLDDLVAYRNGTSFEKDDVEQVINFLQAWDDYEED